MEEFDISEFLKYYYSKIIIVVVAIILGVFFSWHYTTNLQIPMYKSETSLVLTRSNESAMITQNDISLNKNLVSTYREIIRSRRILSKVISNLALDMETDELKRRVSVASANDTELIVISVRDEDNVVARNVANEIASVFKDEITSIYNIENISIVDRATKEDEPYNIHVLKQYVIGFGAGLLLSSMIITVMFYFDDSIKSANDIEEKLGLSVLTSVPKYHGKKKK